MLALLNCQSAHEPDGLPGVVAALQGNPFQFLDGEPSGGVHQGVGAAEGRLPDSQLLLVQAGIGRVKVGVGMGRLGISPIRRTPVVSPRNRVCIVPLRT